MSSLGRIIPAVGGILWGLLLAAACVPDTNWVTPAGVPLGPIDCRLEGRLDDSADGQACRARSLRETPEDIARCEKEGGTPGPFDMLDDQLTCHYEYMARDAGKACSKESDCEIACDGLTKTCRASSPWGAVLDEDGKMIEVIQ